MRGTITLRSFSFGVYSLHFALSERFHFVLLLLLLFTLINYSCIRIEFYHLLSTRGVRVLIARRDLVGDLGISL